MNAFGVGGGVFCFLGVIVVVGLIFLQNMKIFNYFKKYRDYISIDFFMYLSFVLVFLILYLIFG